MQLVPFDWISGTHTAYMHAANTLRLLRLPLSQRQQRSYIRYILQSLQQRNKMQQVVIGGIGNPAFYRDRII
jgi:hypothetical protein